MLFMPIFPLLLLKIGSSETFLMRSSLHIQGSWDVGSLLLGVSSFKWLIIMFLFFCRLPILRKMWNLISPNFARGGNCCTAILPGKIPQNEFCPPQYVWYIIPSNIIPFSIHVFGLLGWFFAMFDGGVRVLIFCLLELVTLWGGVLLGDILSKWSWGRGRSISILLLSMMLFLMRVVEAGWLDIESEAASLWERWEEVTAMETSAIAETMATWMVEASAEASSSSSTWSSWLAALVAGGVHHLSEKHLHHKQCSCLWFRSPYCNLELLCFLEHLLYSQFDPLVPLFPCGDCSEQWSQPCNVLKVGCNDSLLKVCHIDDVSPCRWL